MPGYTSYARFYDQLMGRLQPTADGGANRFSARTLSGISRHRPQAASLLELGCGTGEVLAGLTALPSLTGLDLSPQMLAQARVKVPGAVFVEADMAAFDLGRQFDVVICVFDTLNHLQAFDEWLSLFRCVHAHLASGGVFLFDVVTAGGFRRLSDQPPFVHDFGCNTLIASLAVTDSGLAEWDMRVFERQADGRFALSRERIGELAVDIDRITGALAPGFDLVELTDQFGKPPADDTDRAYFVAVRR